MKQLPAIILIAMFFAPAIAPAQVSTRGTTTPERRRTGSELRLLQGSVTNRSEKPIANAVVYLKNTKTLVVKTFLAGDDGAYRFPALSPNVDYQVYADHNGKRSGVKTLSAFDSHHEARINLKIDE